METTTVLVLIGAGVLVTLVMLALVVASYRRVPGGRALLITKLQRSDVTLSGGVVVPLVHSAEEIDISVKTIEIDLRGREAPHCGDSVRVDMRLCFHVRVNPTVEDILAVARTLGAARASDPDALRELFRARFCEAVRQAVAAIDHRELLRQSDPVRDHIVEIIGRDLNGFVLDDVAIESAQVTPIAALDPDDTLDAVGIRTITEITAREKLRQARVRHESALALARHDLEARQAILELERQRAEIEARHQVEIDLARARACVDTLRALADEEARLAEARGVVSDTDERVAAAAEQLERIKAESQARLRQLDADTRARLDELEQASDARRAGLAADSPTS